MAVKIKDTNRIPDIIKVLESIKRKRIEIGVFGSDNSFMTMIATVHEFGVTIRPKKQFLAIPTPLAGDKNPRDFSDLSFVPIDGGRKGLLVRNRKGRGRKGDRSEIYFVLVRQVKIPERSFLRSTFDEKNGEWSKFLARQLGDVLMFKMTVDVLMERVGQRIAADVQQTIRQINSPPNKPITVANKGSSNPLIDSGRLRQSVVYKVVNA
ncbi:MAG: hypothetical protein K0Q94_558 [Paenibacillus sp.]|jgi:phage gpG-like protein|nr:hypothetical protein [Paenibacillus sp.]